MKNDSNKYYFFGMAIGAVIATAIIVFVSNIFVASAYWDGSDQLDYSVNVTTLESADWYEQSLNLVVEATTTIDQLSFYVSGSCSGSGYPRLSVINYGHATQNSAEIADFNYAVPTLITFSDLDMTIYPYSGLPVTRIRIDCQSGNYYYWGAAVNPFDEADVSMVSNSGSDYNSIMYFDIDGPELPPGPSFSSSGPDYSLLTWRSDINTVTHQFCFLGEPCNLWFSFNEKAIGREVYFLPDVAGEQDPDHAVASTTIEYSGVWQNYIEIPIEESFATSTNCLYLVDPVYGDALYCGIGITWISEDEFSAYLEGVLDYLTICDSVATSSGEFFDDFRYGLECGARKFVWWLTDIDPKSIGFFSGNVEKLKESFPLNTVYSIVGIFQDTIASTTLSDNGSFPMPMIDKEGNIEMIPVISSSSLPATIGAENSSLFRTAQDWLLYGFTSFLITLIVIREFV